jgi:hypothetical protein
MKHTETAPDERSLGAVPSARLSNLTGLPASEFEGHTVAALSERLRWAVDPDLWLFRRVCGQVVKTDPVTGMDLPVPNATVEVFDTVCDYWGFFPEPWPWGWLFPTHCQRDLIATVVTDDCGNFCFWVPRFTIEWIRRWREERVCFPELFHKPTVGDLLTPRIEGPVPVPPPGDPLGLVNRLRDGGDLAATLGARAATVLSAARGSAEFGSNTGLLGELLRSPAFARPVAPPLVGIERDDDLTLEVGPPAEIDPARFVGPFLRCVEVLVPEWYELLEVPDVSLTVTQALTGGVQTIYDGAFDIPWGTSPIPPIVLHAAPIAVASHVPCPPPQVNPDLLGFQYVGLLPVSPSYAAGGTFDGATGFATRVNQPRPGGPPCTCDQVDLTVPPSCQATAPFYGELYLYGGVDAPGATYYRIMAQYAAGSGLPTPGSFGPAAPLLDAWSVPQLFPAPPVVIQPVNPSGWYAIAELATESGPYTNMLMDWSDAKADGVYLLTLELADAAMNPIPLSPDPTLLLVVDGSAPVPATPFVLSWQPVAAVDGPIDPLAWMTAYPPASGCALIDAGGSAIALQFVASASSPHLRQAYVSAEGCGGATPSPAAGNPPDSQWYRSSTDPSATSYSFSGIYYLPAGAPAGCYSFGLYADTRAFNSAGGTTSDPVHTGWCGDEPGPPYTDVVITVAIV